MSGDKVDVEHQRTSLAWFVFVTIFLGQLGVLLSIAHGLWIGGDLCAAVTKQMLAGNFLTFSTAFLASSLYFLVKEYAEGEKIVNSVEKARLLLVAAILGLCSIVFVYLILVFPEDFGFVKRLLHWVLYVASIWAAFRFWNLEQESGLSVPAGIKKSANKITKKAAANKAASDGTPL